MVWCSYGEWRVATCESERFLYLCAAGHWQDAGCRRRAAGVEEVLLLLLRFLRGYRALHLVKAHEDPEVQP